MEKQKFVCVWSIEIIFGKQKQAVEIMKNWREEKFRSSNFKVSKARIMNGFIGDSPSHILDEYIFESMEDFEKAIADMAQPQFREFPEALAPFVVPASQKWTVYKMLD